MKETTTTTTRQAITEVYSTYEKDTAAVLANLHRTTPAPLLEQLQNARRADEIARANPATAESIAEAEAAHEAAREAIAEVDRISHRITAAQAERIAAAQEGESLRAEADEERATAADLQKVISRTLSDRADLVQVAAAADLEEPTPQELETAARRAEERGEDLTAEEIHARAKQRHRRNAVARYIRGQRSGNALNGTHTDTTPATAEQVAQWKAAGKPTTEDYKEPTKGGTISLVWREQTKSRPAGFYFIRRRYTVNQWQSIEALTEDGQTAGIIRTQNEFAADLAAVERLEALATAADLTAREREFLAIFCGRAARQAGAESRRAYHTEKGAKATEAGANEAEYTARKAYAFSRIGLTTDTARRQFFSRLCRRLYAAAQIEQGCQTPAEYAEKDRRYWESLQRDSRRGYTADRTPRPDLIAAQSKAAAEHTRPAAVIKWTESNAPAEPTSGKDYRAAEIERRAAENAKAAERAAKAAKSKAEARAEASRAAADFAAKWRERPAHEITAAEFNAIPAAARLAYLESIHADGKRLAIVSR